MRYSTPSTHPLPFPHVSKVYSTPVIPPPHSLPTPCFHIRLRPLGEYRSRNSVFPSLSLIVLYLSLFLSLSFSLSLSLCLSSFFLFSISLLFLIYLSSFSTILLISFLHLLSFSFFRSEGRKRKTQDR